MTYPTELSGVGVVGETELYEFMFPTPEYYTTQSRELTLPAGHALNPATASRTYKPFPVTRDRLADKGGAKAVSIKITLPSTKGTQGQILAGGDGLVEVNIIRGFGDALATPENFRRFWFRGIMTDLAVNGPLSTVTVKDRRYIFAQKKIPRLRVTRQCGYALYETGGKNGKCDVVESAFTHTFIVSSILDSGKSVILNSVPGSGEDDPDVAGSPGKFSLGRAWLTSNPKSQSFISGHSWDGANATIDMHNPIVGLLAGSLLSLSWGCDWRPATCKDKFSNFDNFLGFPKLPSINPATTVVFNKP